MAEFPLAINVQGDYGYKVIVVDDGDTIEQVINTATDQIVGILVPIFPEGTVLRARLHGSEQPIDNNIIVKDAKLMKMEALQVYAE
ncbi:MAG: hypothetical protein ACI845_001469 [Gammaproteobacteria bacterium]|jgi:hypothetical protein